jgi:hypothetical protein
VEPFKEIEGAVLESISTSEATYVDVGDKNELLKVKGCSLDFDLGQLVVENPFIVVSPNQENIAVQQLVGLKVKSAHSNNEEIRIIFESGAYIEVVRLSRTHNLK